MNCTTRVFDDFRVEVNQKDFYEEPPISKFLEQGKKTSQVKNKLDSLIEIVRNQSSPRSIYMIDKKNKFISDFSGLPASISDTERLILAITTIGETNKDNNLTSYEEFLLDGTRNIYLRHLNRQICQEIAKKVNKNGFNTTCPVFPGSGRSDWEMVNQKTIYEILKGEKIGVNLTGGNMLKPEKSCTFVMGADKNIEQENLLVSCERCEKEDCMHRRIPG